MGPTAGSAISPAPARARPVVEYGRFVSFTPPALSALRPHCTLGRSFGLLDDFKYEQTDPDRFYGHLAEDTVALLEGIAAGAGPTKSAGPGFTTDGGDAGTSSSEGPGAAIRPDAGPSEEPTARVVSCISPPSTPVMAKNRPQ